MLVNSRSWYFAFIMGYVRNLIENKAIVENFGLKVILNCVIVQKNEMSKINIGSNQGSSNE